MHNSIDISPQKTDVLACDDRTLSAGGVRRLASSLLDRQKLYTQIARLPRATRAFMVAGGPSTGRIFTSIQAEWTS